VLNEGRLEQQRADALAAQRREEAQLARKDESLTAWGNELVVKDEELEDQAVVSG